MALDVIDISAEGLAAYVGSGKPHRKAVAESCRRPENVPLFNGM
jgi:hypothetical protein